MLDTATHTAPTTPATPVALLPSTGRATGEPLTMSSLEIAELLGARHDNVKRTIERVAHSGATTLPPLEEVSNTGFGPQTITVYRLDKRSSLIVVAQLSPEFTARIVDRWQELEAALPALPALPTTLPDALRFAAEQAERAIEAEKLAAAQRAALAIAGPKADAYDAFLDSDGLRPIRDVAKMVEMRPSDLTAGLKKKKAIYKDDSKWKPTAAFAARGYAKLVPVPCPDGRTRDQLYLTPKGVEWSVKTFGPKFD